MINKPDRKVSLVKIETFSELQLVRDSWEEVYAKDPHAHLFLSWDWLSEWFRIGNRAWMILAVKDLNTSSYIGFFPIAKSKSIFQLLSPVRKLWMAGRPLASYTGFICVPGRETDVCRVWADYIKEKLSWDKFLIKGIADERFNLFEHQFQLPDFSVNFNTGSNSYRIELPSTWDEYLKVSIGKQTRKTLVRLSNKAIRENIIMRTSSSETIVEDVDTLMSLWEGKWGSIDRVPLEKAMLFHFFKTGDLWLNILWNDKVAVAAQACLIDKQMKTIYAYITGYNKNYRQYSPGNLVGFFSLNKAIEHGLEKYDFLLGADPYKISLGAREREVKNLTIVRHNFRTGLLRALKRIKNRR